MNLADLEELGGESWTEADMAFHKAAALVLLRLDIVQAVFLYSELALQYRSLTTWGLSLSSKVHNLVAARESSSARLAFSVEREVALGDQIRDFPHLFLVFFRLTKAELFDHGPCVPRTSECELVFVVFSKRSGPFESRCHGQSLADLKLV